MYTLIFESGYVEHVIGRHLLDIEQCEERMIYFCEDHNILIMRKKTWQDDTGRLVYDLGLDEQFFICIEEK